MSQPYMLYPFRITPFLEKLKNDIPKIKWLLFLNHFDYRHNPGVFPKETLEFAFQESELLYSVNKVTEAKTQ